VRRLWEWLAFRWDVRQTRRFARRLVALKKSADIDPPPPAPEPTRSQVDEFSRRITGKNSPKSDEEEPCQHRS